MNVPHNLGTFHAIMRAVEVNELPKQKTETAEHLKQQIMGGTTSKQQEEGSWHDNFEQEETGPPPCKKVKLDATRDHCSTSCIPEKSSAKDPSVVESIAEAMDCEAKTSSTEDSSCTYHYHEPNEKDIVFGKGRFIQNLAGNVKLRKLITSHFDQYESADSPQDKTLLAMRLVADIKESGGKFLKEDPSTPGRYIEVGSITAREKIAATFHSHRRRHKQTKTVQVTSGTAGTEELKHKTLSTTRTETSSLRSPSTTSLMGGNKGATMDRMLAFPVPSSVMHLGVVGRQGKLFGGSPLVNTPSGVFLHHGLNLSPRRAFELSGELAMISRTTDTTNNTIPIQGSIAHVYDRVPGVEKYDTTGSTASREKTLHKQMGNPKVGSALSARSMLEVSILPAPGRNKDRVTLHSSSVSAGCNANTKNTQARLQLTRSCDSSIMYPPRSSTSSRYIGTSSRRMSPTHAAHDSDSRTASNFESATNDSHHFSAQEALQAQLYREMGLPGF